MTFEKALHELKRRGMVKRVDWPGDFLVLVEGREGEAPVQGLFPQGTSARMAPYIAFSTADRVISPWQPGQSDLLSDDWIAL